MGQPNCTCGAHTKPTRQCNRWASTRVQIWESNKLGNLLLNIFPVTRFMDKCKFIKVYVIIFCCGVSHNRLTPHNPGHFNYTLSHMEPLPMKRMAWPSTSASPVALYSMYTYVRNGKRASDGRIFLKGGTEKRDGINHASHSDSICIPHQTFGLHIRWIS